MIINFQQKKEAWVSAIHLEKSTDNTMPILSTKQEVKQSFEQYNRPLFSWRKFKWFAGFLLVSSIPFNLVFPLSDNGVANGMLLAAYAIFNLMIFAAILRRINIYINTDLDVLFATYKKHLEGYNKGGFTNINDYLLHVPKFQHIEVYRFLNIAHSYTPLAGITLLSAALNGATVGRIFFG